MSVIKTIRNLISSKKKNSTADDIVNEINDLTNQIQNLIDEEEEQGRYLDEVIEESEKFLKEHNIDISY